MSPLIDSKFVENLRMTQHYCARQLLHTEKNEAKILRSINPEYSGKRIFEFVWHDHRLKNQKNHIVSRWNIDVYEMGVGETLFESQLGFKKENVVDNIDTNVSGQILVCEFLCTTEDGVSEAESSGFIDITDLPPIDTWFYLESRYLYAWIPDRFVSLAQNAIDVNALGSLHWKEQPNTV